MRDCDRGVAVWKPREAAINTRLGRAHARGRSKRERETDLRALPSSASRRSLSVPVAPPVLPLYPRHPVAQHGGEPTRMGLPPVRALLPIPCQLPLQDFYVGSPSTIDSESARWINREAPGAVAWVSYGPAGLRE